AGEHLARAAIYYHFAKFVFVQDRAQMRAAHMKAVECYSAALPYMRPAGLRVSIPFAGTLLHGVLRKPPATEKHPVLVMAPGLGGYYAPRAAAFEKRIRACIALSGPFDWAEIWDALPELTRSTFVSRSHSKDEAEAKKRAATLTLKEAAKSIVCPLFIVAGRQ